jgi:hypothetical protein
MTLIVPVDSEDFYKTANVWQDFFSIQATTLTLSPTELSFTAATGSNTVTDTTLSGC